MDKELRECLENLIHSSLCTCKSASSILEYMHVSGPPYSIEDIEALNDAFKVLYDIVNRLKNES